MRDFSRTWHSRRVAEAYCGRVRIMQQLRKSSNRLIHDTQGKQGCCVVPALQRHRHRH